MQALEVKIKGIVQGVGFRPFIHRLVRRHDLCGTIRNTSSGVTMELEGEQGEISAFLQELPLEAPPLAVIEEIRSRELPVKSFETFTIICSERQEERNTLISPDITACGNSGILQTGDIASRLSTAPTADRASPSSRTCRMTARKLR